MTTLQTREPTQRARVGSRHHTTASILLDAACWAATGVIAVTALAVSGDVLAIFAVMGLLAFLPAPGIHRGRPSRPQPAVRRDDVPNYMPGGWPAEGESQ